MSLLVGRLLGSWDQASSNIFLARGPAFSRTRRRFSILTGLSYGNEWDHRGPKPTSGPWDDLPEQRSRMVPTSRHNLVDLPVGVPLLGGSAVSRAVHIVGLGKTPGLSLWPGSFLASLSHCDPSGKALGMLTMTNSAAIGFSGNSSKLRNTGGSYSISRSPLHLVSTLTQPAGHPATPSNSLRTSLLPSPENITGFLSAFTVSGVPPFAAGLSLAQWLRLSAALAPAQRRPIARPWNPG